MGRDIHTFIVRNNKIIKEDIYEGRDYNWFENLYSGHKNASEYKYLGDYKVTVPEIIMALNSGEEAYYGHGAIRVGDFRKWYELYQPYRKAAWAHKSDAWIYKKKGIIPGFEEEVFFKYISLDEGEVIEDFEFIEYECHDGSTDIYKATEDCEEDDLFVYFFDC